MNAKSDDQAAPEALKGGVFVGGFSTYRTVTPQEYKSVLESGLVVPDTNFMLDLYRYHESTRDEFLQIFEVLGDCLWVPNHVMFEFLERRVGVLEERSEYLKATRLDLQSLINKYIERLAAWANRFGLHPDVNDEALDLIDSASRKIEETIVALSEGDDLESAEDTDKDPVLQALIPILNDRVGRPLPAHELKLARAEARRRIEEKYPPGYMDANKKGENAEGDYLIWHETLREASRRQVDVLFVTRDVKKDWWRMEKGQAKGPRWELAAELEARAGSRLFMLRPASLLKHASDLLAVQISEDAVQDAQRVSSRGFNAWNVRMDLDDLPNAVMDFLHQMTNLMKVEPESALVDLFLNPLRRLVEKSSLDNTWEVIEVSISVPDIRGLKPDEQKVMLSLQRLHVVALQVWLNEKADSYIKQLGVSSIKFDFGSLPPGVAVVKAHPFIWDEEGAGAYEFSITLDNGETHTLVRAVPLGNSGASHS